MAELTDLGKFVDELRQYEDEAIVGLYPEIAGKPITHGDIVVARNVGNPNAKHFMVTEIIDGKPYAFNARLYAAVPGTYGGKIHPAVKDNRSYQFLRKAGIEEVQRSCVITRAPNWLFTENIPGHVFREIFTGEMRLPELKRLARFMAEFQQKATRYAASYPEVERDTILGARSIESQVEDYIIKYMNAHLDKSNTDAAKYVASRFMELFGEVLRGDTVCHGDLSPDNIIQHAGTNKFYLIDPELKRRNGFADLGSWFSYIGNHEDMWDSVAEAFRLSQIELAVQAENAKPRVDPLTAALGGKYKLEDNGRGRAALELQGNIACYSLRIIAKRKFLGRTDYLEQDRNLFTVLGTCAREQGRFGLGNEQAEIADELEETLRPFSITYKADTAEEATTQAQ